MFSCRTKLAKLLCLKCFGRMCFVNFSFFDPCQLIWCLSADDAPCVRVLTSSTTKLSPSFPHRTTLSSCGFSNILARLVRRRGAIHAPLQTLTCTVCEPGRAGQRICCDRGAVRCSALEVSYKIARIVRAGRVSIHRDWLNGQNDAVRSTRISCPGMRRRRGGDDPWNRRWGMSGWRSGSVCCSR